MKKEHKAILASKHHRGIQGYRDDNRFASTFRGSHRMWLLHKAISDGIATRPYNGLWK